MEWNSNDDQEGPKGNINLFIVNLCKVVISQRGILMKNDTKDFGLTVPSEFQATATGYTCFIVTCDYLLCIEFQVLDKTEADL